MGITASENFSSKSVNFAVSKSVRRGLNDNVDWFISPHCDKLEFEESDQLIHIKYLKKDNLLLFLLKNVGRETCGMNRSKTS